MTGIFPAKLPIVAKKSPNKTKMPYSSIKKPTNGHRSKISRIPATKAAVPFHFCRRAKNTAVFCRPMMRVRPTINRICRRRSTDGSRLELIGCHTLPIASLKDVNEWRTGAGKEGSLHGPIEEQNHSSNQEEAPF